VRDHQCISCLECTSDAACPVPATVDMLALPGRVKDSFTKPAPKGGRGDIQTAADKE
jgi:hypothetical protein